jgi:deazaflavin-dependent oxidoreductase (nitroreductase family)
LKFVSKSLTTFGYTPQEGSIMEQNLASFFKVVNVLMVLMWRMGLGGMMNLTASLSGRIMVINHIGRRSGLRRRTPVNFVRHGDEVICAAGFEHHRSDWYRNVQATPEVELWLPDGRYRAHGEDITNSPQRPTLMRELLIAAGFAAPVFAGVHPLTDSDEQIARVTSGYPLVRFSHLEKMPGLYADLWWMWLVIIGAIGVWLVIRSPR